MFLDYFALFLLFFVAIVIFYSVIAIHDIPYEVAKKRNHPQQDALHVAGWISLFTLHTIWPFLWIWATLYREDRGWGFMPKADSAGLTVAQAHATNVQELNRIESELIAQFRDEMQTLTQRLETLESLKKTAE